MRRLTSIALLALFFSCSSPDAKTPVRRDSTAIAPMGAAAGQPAYMTLDTLLPFPGVWVNSRYVDAIRKTRSPRNSQNAAGISFFTIPERTLRPVEICYGFHEGGEGLIVVKEGKRYRMYTSDGRELTYEMSLVSRDLLRIGDQTYVHLPHPDSTLYDRGILEDLLFAGNYTDPQGKTVSFGANGRISGLDTLTYFSPQCDYVEDIENFEKVFMGSQPDVYKMMEYGYRLAGDSLILYRLDRYHYDSVAKQYDSVVLGERLRSLVRVR